MTRGVRRTGDWAYKDVAARAAATVEALVRRTERLRERGVRTPAARYDAARQSLVFRWCEGTPGRAALRAHLERAGGDWSRLPRAALARVLAPLLQLHAVPACGLALEPIDPWRRIDPRLPTLTPSRAALAIPVRAALGALLDGARPATARPVHGDFHAGQVLLPGAAEEPWLLDLDDLGLGAPEGDLGNFVAHVVTSDDLFRGDPVGGVAVVGERLCAAYAARGGPPCDLDLVRRHAAVALLRRALKLAERGLGDAGFARVVHAAGDLAGRP